MNTTIEILRLERDRLEVRYSAQRSLLDSIISKLENYDQADQDTPVPPVPPVPDVPPVPAAPVPRPLRLAKKTRNADDAVPQRESPRGSKAFQIRRAIISYNGPFTAMEIATIAGLPKTTVSGFVSTRVARGELNKAGKLEGTQLYVMTAAFQRPKPENGANGVEQKYSEFRSGLNLKVPEIKLGFTERENP